MKPPRLIGAHLIVAALLFLAFATGSRAAEQRDPSFRLLTRYNPMEAKEAGTQTFAIAEDDRGVLYFGNIGGVVEFDGVWWRLIKLRGDSPAFVLASLPDGRIAVAGMDEFGYLEADATGATVYVSLVEKLPENLRDAGEFLYVHSTRDGVVFVSTKLIAVWRPDGIRVIRKLEDSPQPPRAFLVEDRVWLALPDGLWRIVGDEIERIPGGELFKDRKVRMVLPWSKGRQLVGIRDEGLRIFDGRSVEPFAPEVSDLANRFLVMTGVRLSDGRYAIATLQGGVIVMTPEGEIDEVIDSSTGLPDEDISDAVVTSDGSLWLAMDSSIARIEATSALTVVDARGGLRGTPVSIVRHGGAIYAGTTSGLYKLVRPKGWLSGDLAPRRIAHPVGDDVRSAWAFVAAGDDLLVGTGDGVLVIRGDGEPRKLEGTGEMLCYALLQSTVDPDLVWAGMREGLGAARRKGGEWVWEGIVEGGPENIRTIVEESAGKLWAGTGFDGVARIELTGEAGRLPIVQVTAFGKSEASVFRLAGRIVFTTDEKRILRLDEATGKFSPDPVLGGLGNESVPYALADDLEGNIWMNTRPVGVGRRQARGAYEFDDRILMNMPGNDIQAIYVEHDGSVWFGTEAGLVRYDSRLPRRPDPPRAPLIRRVTVNGEAIQGAAGGLVVVPAGARRVRFETAAVSYERGVQYQYRLSPIETAWTPWTNEPVTEFTNLWEGDYTLLVRSRSPRGDVSRELSWTFRVLPPWYRTTWAWVCWIAIGLLIVVALPVARNRSLRNRARLLEEQVSEKTGALTHTVEQLRIANEKLEELSFDDPLTGIPNRRRFDQAMDGEWKRARRAGKPVGFVLIDLDHFKSLNDTKGHQFGDEALQRIAAYLERSLRRTGDLVARYGGEEFTVILPNTELAGAMHFAEQLRAGIEKLAISNDGSPFRYVTASFGVGSVIPAENVEPHALIAAADRALYRAKGDGRNCVRAAV